MTVSVVISTYGNNADWIPYVERARESAWNQKTLPYEVLTEHGPTLAAARNRGAERAIGKWLIFLDADDELDEGYVEAMLAAEGDIRRPATLGVYPNGETDDFPVMIPRRPLLEANFIVIGAMVERERFLKVGGFDELPRLEDWDTFIRLWLDGAEIVDVPDAIYRVHIRPDSRNQGDALHGQVYLQIRAKYAGRTP